MAGWTPNRSGGRTELNVDPSQLVWALYGRESDDPDGDAVQVTYQLTDLRAFALGIGGRIAKEFAENDTSAFKKIRVRLPDGTDGYRVYRPDWDEMLTAFRRGTYNALALINIDRGMRDPRDLEDLIDLVERYGVFVVGMTGVLDLTTDAGISSARTEVNQRNQESRNISRRVSTGKRRSALKGKNSGSGSRPFGWQADRIHLDETESALILEAVNRVFAKTKVRTIVMDWQKRGIPTVTGKKWVASVLSQILVNPRLCGLQTYKSEPLRDTADNPVYGEWEPILTVEQHQALVEILGPFRKPSPIRDGRGNATKHLLSPFLRCGRCNCRMRAGTRPQRNGERQSVYRCPSASDGGCAGVSRKLEDVDKLITALVIADHKQLKFRKTEDLPEWARQSELVEVQTQIAEALENFKAKRISGARFYPLIEGLESEERILLADKKKYSARRQTTIASVEDLEQKWSDPDFSLEQRQSAIAESLISVVVHPAGRGARTFNPNLIEPIWRSEHGPQN
ncbi:recombinase family protein [Longispora sp. NPDC051575]|uniref:recombinase family protein n=1 Tax=Longispora sp. NPDC051575 TaxID=3154943 RepID=UPI00343A28D4